MKAIVGVGPTPSRAMRRRLRRLAAYVAAEHRLVYFGPCRKGHTLAPSEGSAYWSVECSCGWGDCSKFIRSQAEWFESFREHVREKQERAVVEWFLAAVKGARS